MEASGPSCTIIFNEYTDRGRTFFDRNMSSHCNDAVLFPSSFNMYNGCSSGAVSSKKRYDLYRASVGLAGAGPCEGDEQCSHLIIVFASNDTKLSRLHSHQKRSEWSRLTPLRPATHLHSRPLASAYIRPRGVDFRSFLLESTTTLGNEQLWQKWPSHVRARLPASNRRRLLRKHHHSNLRPKLSHTPKSSVCS